ncbi:MAG TPA: GNAT family N-acetyltransferase [Streptosporangiaceae bacterium]|nr:GNAT family N-acetyltransferase [Streptosporangiaceae bacterium]
MSDLPQVTDNREDSRLELTADGHRAELIYRQRGGRLVLRHTGVPAAIGGRGLGGQLVAAALARAAADGLTVVPLCPFARDWLERHPAAAATVTVDWGDRPPAPPAAG